MPSPVRILADDSLTGLPCDGAINDYKPGQTVDFTAIVDVMGLLTDAPTLALVVHSQYGGIDIATAPTRDGLGRYSATVTLPTGAVPGVWVARWTIPGVALCERRFVVSPLDF